MRPKSFIAAIGGLLVVAGLIVGAFVDTTVVATTSGFVGRGLKAVSCGSTFLPADLSTTPFGTDRLAVQAQCSDAGNGLIVWLLILVGLVTIAGAYLIKNPRPAQTAAIPLPPQPHH